MNKMRPSVFRAIDRRQYTGNYNTFPEIAKDDESLVQRFALLKSLPIHQGCVNTICWNEKGNLILSGSDDQHLVITNGYTYEVEANYCTSHHANIFSAKFLPGTGDQQVVSCSGDGIILHTDLTRPQETYYNQFTCHSGTTTYEVITIPNDSNTFLSCGEDGTVRWFDLRTKRSCNKQKCKDDILVSCQRAITALAINPQAPYQLAVGCADSMVRIYDRRYLSTQAKEHLTAQPFCTFVAPGFGEDRHYRITSLSYDREGRDMLVSYSSDYLYLFSVLESTATELHKPAAPSSSSPNKKQPSGWDRVRAAASVGGAKRERASPPPVRRLRLRGDWSDTGPDARPERDSHTSAVAVGQARPHLQATLMQRMTDVLSRMLNDPMTRAALSAGGEDSLQPEEGEQAGEAGEGRMSVEEDGSEAATDRASVPQSSSSAPATPIQPASSTSPSSPGQQSQSVTSQLHSHLTALRNLREGFINQHGAEPSVSFRYSQQSTSNSTISLRVVNDINRNFEEEPNVPSTSNGTSSSLKDNNSDADVDLDYYGEEKSMSKSEPAVEKSEEKCSIYEAEMKRKYVGHRNARTMIKEACFWGTDYVMSGSDCGHVFVWRRTTGELCMLLQADQHVVNCLQPHPYLPLLATSGIDHDVKLWAPTAEEGCFNAEAAEDLIKRNAIMLEETRDTITVPAAFMIRMLACLNQIRRSARNRNRTNSRSVDEDSM